MPLFTKKAIPDKQLPLTKQHIDFLKPTPEAPHAPAAPPAPRRFPIKKIAVYICIFIILAITGFSTKIIISGNEASQNFNGGGILTQLKNLFLKKNTDIEGIKENRVNILLLGIGGEGHEGPNLTDTIILASINPEEKKAALISIPRDLYVSDSLIGGAKINALYAYGQVKNESGGAIIKDAVERAFGIPVHYYAVIDFNAFIEFIDALGGVDVTVETAFTDPQYPTLDYKTKVVSFEAGLQHINGARALQFVRSRHGNNGEGSDFARARRQQKVMLAVKEKTLRLGVLLRPDRINRMITIAGNSFETDMELWETLQLAKIASDIEKNNITQVVLDDAPDGYLRSTVGADGAFLLLPKNKEQLKDLAQTIFELNYNNEEQAKVVVQNGTTIPGLAGETKAFLEQNGFTVLRVENASKQSYVKTVIFDLSHGSKASSLAYLQEHLNANVSTYVSADLWRDNTEADFVIIVGENENS